VGGEEEQAAVRGDECEQQPRRHPPRVRHHRPPAETGPCLQVTSPLTPSLPSSLSHSLTHARTHSLTLSLKHSLTHSLFLLVCSVTHLSYLHTHSAW